MINILLEHFFVLFHEYKVHTRISYAIQFLCQRLTYDSIDSLTHSLRGPMLARYFA